MISRVLRSLVDEWRRSFRRQKVGGFSRARRGATASGGCLVDKDAAARLFKRAAERGHSRAAANLANLGADPQE